MTVNVDYCCAALPVSIRRDFPPFGVLLGFVWFDSYNEPVVPDENAFACHRS
jgi:hypothetical protein